MSDSRKRSSVKVAPFGEEGGGGLYFQKRWVGESARFQNPLPYTVYMAWPDH